MPSNRRPDVPENVGGPASCGNAERLGPHQDLRPLATPTGVGVALSHEDVRPGTRETDYAARGEAYARGVTYARADHDAAFDASKQSPAGPLPLGPASEEVLAGPAGLGRSTAASRPIPIPRMT